MQADRTVEIIENLLRETAPESIRVVVSTKHPPREVREGGPGEKSQTYIETRQGERYFDDQIIALGRPVARRASYCDGDRCINITYRREDVETQDKVGISNDFMFDAEFGFRSAPDPIRYYHVGLTPLHEALPTAERLLDEQVIGRDCDVFHFEGVGRPGREQSLVYALDKETSVPLRVSAYNDPEFLDSGVPNWVWEAESLDRVGEHHYPKASKLSSYVIRNADGERPKAELDVVTAIRAEEVVFDASYPASTFWPDIQPGIRVFDLIEGGSYVAGGGEEAVSDDLAVSQIQEDTPPIRVGEPGTGAWMGGVGITLSIAVLVVAFLLRKRIA
ncbi:hypothetical protein [Tautonia rosea]|uniref:hypothetical protein n=1 Tax=Tautonia rosea TaxID=2728037 RepID=UPI001474BCD2|nr:hypothetical protein [Tautonia rosea]